MILPHTLSYETREARGRPAWVYVVVSLYLAAILGFLVLTAIACFEWAPPLGSAVVALATIAAPFVVGGGLLILVPIRAQRRRPMRRRSIWLPLAGSVILLGVLCFAAVLATGEFLRAQQNASRLIIASAAAVWLLWTLLFWWVSRSLDPLSLSAWLYKAVFAGSLLELVVAVPMHLAVRRRHECCAGISTAAAIGLGTVTAVVSLGPGVFFLYHRRWKQAYRPRPQSTDSPPSAEVHAS